MGYNVEITAIVSITIALSSLMITIIMKTSDSFNSKTKKYNDTIETLYLRILDIYTSKNKDEKIKEFLDNIYLDGINTTLLLEEHFTFLLLKESYVDEVDFEEIRLNFEDFARSIEELYWKRYELVHYKAVQSDNWIQELKKTLLMRLTSIVFVLSRVNSYLVWSFPLALISLIASHIARYLKLDILIIDGILVFSFSIFILWTIFGMFLVSIEQLLLKKVKKNYISISGNTFIRDRTKTYMQNYTERIRLKGMRSY